MADEPTETSQETSRQAGQGLPRRRGGKKMAVTVLIVLILAAVAAVGTWHVMQARPDLQSRILDIFKGFPFTAADVPPEPAPPRERALTPAFTHREAGVLLSNEDVLMMVGKRPGDPSQALLQSLERPATPSHAEEKKPPPEAEQAAEKPLATEEPAPASQEPSPSAVKPQPEPEPVVQPAPQLVETPIVHPREPGTTQTKKKSKRVPSAIEVPKQAVVEPVPIPETAQKAEKEPPRAEKPSGKVPTPVAGLKPPESESEEKAEKYQLPGSLRVEVQNYKGAKVKWGLMVIMDDSAVMAKKLKTWETSRLDTGSQLVSKLPAALTAGSKLAVRDFYCKKQDDTKAGRVPLCLSHSLYSWSELPCRGLDEKLKKLDPGGATNPCAAAAYAVKSEFGGLGDLKPRVLIVTAGARRCKLKEVLAETDKKGTRGAVKIDVVALGMSTKALQGYSALSQKTGGTFMKIERPADLEPALARYTKTLHTPTMKQMDVRGEKASFKIGNGEEITLAPGTYTVVLPQMPGLDQSKRTIKNIRVGSGQTSVLNVNVAKGRVEVTTEKK